MSDGRVTAYTGKCELGQGLYTAQTQLIAEELGVPLDRVTLIQCDTASTPDQGTTSGAQSHHANFNRGNLALAAATARQALIRLASARLGVPADRLAARDGAIAVTGDPARARELRRPRRRPEVRPPARRQRQATISRGLDRARHVRAAPRPSRDGDRPVRVRPQRARRRHAARRRRPAAARERDAAVASTRRPCATFRALSAWSFGRTSSAWSSRSPGRPCRRRRSCARPGPMAAGCLPPAVCTSSCGTAAPAATRSSWIPATSTSGSQAAARVVKATYHYPYQMHGSLATSCAVADVREGKATIWSATQAVYPLRSTTAMLLGLRPDDVRVIFRMGSGCYGLNGADTVSYDAALLSQAVGRPVRVQLSRADEMAWENYGMAYVIDQRVGARR